MWRSYQRGIPREALREAVTVPQPRARHTYLIETDGINCATSTSALKRVSHNVVWWGYWVRAGA